MYFIVYCLFLINFSCGFNNPILYPERSRNVGMTDVYYKIASFDHSYLNKMNQSELFSIIDEIVDKFQLCGVEETRSLTKWIYCMFVVLLWIALLMTGIFLYFNSLVKNLCKIIRMCREENGDNDNKSTSSGERKNQRTILGMFPMRQATSKYQQVPLSAGG